MRVHASRLDGGRARIQAARAVIGGYELHGVQLDCADFAVMPEQRCRGGMLRARGYGPWPVEFSVRGAKHEIEATLRVERNVRVEIQGVLGGRQPHLALRSGSLDVARLLAGIPALRPYAPAGRVDLALELTLPGTARPLQARAHLALSGARFASADGLRAAEAISAVIDMNAHRDGERWNGQMSVDWRDGELLWDSLYLRGGGTVLSSAVALSSQTVDLSDVALDLAGVGRVSGEASFGREPLALRRARAQGTGFDLQALNERYVAPLFAARGWPALTLRGQADLSAELDDSGLSSAAVHLRDAEVSDTAGRFALQQLDAELPWLRGATSDMRLGVGEARFGRVPFGRFDLQAAVTPDSITFEPARIPVLDAGLRLNALHFERIGERWNGALSADLEPVSMPELTRVLGWPRMAGSLGASVPRVSWRDGVLSLDGQMLIQIFDGYVAANGLQLIEPFSPTPRVLADLQMRYINLEALTDTFKFGRITGRLDGDVTGLELSRWVPVAFDAQIRSSAGDYPRQISQRAVESITALGGPGAAAAIQRSFLGIFERFGYKRIGLSCRLYNGVCEMDGLAANNGGYTLIEGGGLPALSVVGYNRRVDWKELLDRLARVTDAKPVVQ